MKLGCAQGALQKCLSEVSSSVCVQYYIPTAVNCPQTSAVSICNSHHGVHSTAQNFNAGLAMLVDCLVNWAQSVCYSLVNIQKTLENHECSCVNQRIK